MRIFIANKIKAETSHPIKSARIYTTPLHVRHAITHLKQGLTYTKNIGNLIHFQAPAGIFKSEYTVAGNLNEVYDSFSSDKEFSEFMSDNFDAIIWSFSNGLRQNYNLGSPKLLDLIKAEIKIYGFGLGLQKDSLKFKELTPKSQQFLRAFDERAVLWGTRGESTTKWLKKNGFKKPQTLGCPSLYLYPQNILNIKPLPYDKKLSFVTAGHLSPGGFSEKQEFRAQKLINFFQEAKKSHHKVSYVFQDEIFGYKSIEQKHFTYDQANSCLSKETIEEYLRNLCNQTYPFDNYYYFTSVPAWRQLYHHHDCYIGDRFHGGVVGLQSSLPALMVYNDLRVKELSEYFAIPHISLSDLEKHKMEDLIDKSFSEKIICKMKETYTIRVKNFENICSQNGLSMHLSHYVKNLI